MISMTKISRNTVIFGIIALVIIFLIGILAFLLSNLISNNSISGEAITNPDNSPSKQTSERAVDLYFKDTPTECKLDGEVYVNEESLGKSEDGILVLKEGSKDKFKPNSILTIKGLTNSCFAKDANLPFEASWVLSDWTVLEYYFDNNSDVPLNASLELRTPKTAYTIKNFIRPTETEDFVKEISISKGSTQLEDIKKISNYLYSQFNYVSDTNYFKKTEYWETPAEVLSGKKGDCEDWANTLLSAIISYNPSIKCYNLGISDHITTFCYLEDGTYVFIDQDNIVTSLTLAKDGYMQEELIKIRSLKNTYLETYGLDSNKNNIYYAYTNSEFISFENDEEFVKWAINFYYPNYE